MSKEGVKLPVPPEEDEHITVADFLRWKGLCFMHTPNEGKRSWNRGRKLKAMGMQKGIPDFLIFDTVMKGQTAKGVALELKRLKGGSLAPEQKEWLEDLGRRGWITQCCKGADEAIAFIEKVYGK